MKIYITNDNSCTLNYQQYYINSSLAQKFEITDSIGEADIVVITGTCTCTSVHIQRTLDYIACLVSNKKPGAKVILTGCMTREFKDIPILNEVSNWLKNNIDFIIPHNNPNEVLRLISEEDFKDRISDDFGFTMQHSKTQASMYISNGCLNNCSFCKLNYQNYPLKSADILEIKEALEHLNKLKVAELCLVGTNLSQYGYDRYGEFLLPEIIKFLETLKNIKSVSLSGLALKDAIKNDFKSVIKNSTKIDDICCSLESGSDRLLELMRKGYTAKQVVDFIKEIREKKEKNLLVNIISGFPTEKMEDVKTTLAVLEELSPYRVDINRYTNSSFVDSSQYPQLSVKEIACHTAVYKRKLNLNGVTTVINGSGYKFNNL